MTAGSGIIHQEMPKGSNGHMGGLPIMGESPFDAQNEEPRYREVKNEQIPEVMIDKGARIRVISGEVNEKRGPVRDIVVDIEYLDVTMEPGTEFEHAIMKGYRCLPML